MKRIMCKSKIHRATVTQTDINYNGSITIDKTLMERADLVEFEQVQICNITNGQRFTTYVIAGEPDSKIIGINGAAARLAAVGDLVIILSFAEFDDKELKDFSPTFIQMED